MSRVSGYEQRLKALIFKGNFKEKIDEMKEVCFPTLKAPLLYNDSLLLKLIHHQILIYNILIAEKILKIMIF